MDETIFDYLERTRLVDYALAALAVVGPLITAFLAHCWRARPLVAQHRHQWLLGVLAWPTIFLLWVIYNYIMDLYGLDSVFALVLNLGIFLVVALVYVLLEHVLYRHYYGQPNTTAAMPTQQTDTIPSQPPSTESKE